MRVKVGVKGLLIPKKLLKGVKEADIRKLDDQIIVTPLSDVDPIFLLGKNPIDDRIEDGSEKHDKYIYT